MRHKNERLTKNVCVYKDARVIQTNALPRVNKIVCAKIMYAPLKCTREKKKYTSIKRK